MIGLRTLLITKTKDKQVVVFLCSCLWIYLLLRAIFIPVMADEAGTFFEYVITGKFIPPFALLDANNHVLNSFLCWITFKIAGVSLFALRLPSLLAALLFFYFLWKLSKEIKSTFLRRLFILIMLFSRGFIEFFALARGYGMSMALLTGAIAECINAVKKNDTRHFIFCLVYMMLALTANLTLLISQLIITGILFLKVFLSNADKPIVKIVKLKAILLLGLLPAILAVLLLLKMKSSGLLWYGSDNGFTSVTVKSLIIYFSGSYNKMTLYLVIFYCVFSCLMLVFIASGTERRQKFLFTSLPVVLLLAGNVISIVMFSKLIHVNYPEDRTALYFFPLLITSFFLTADALQGRAKLFAIVISFPLLFLPFEFVRSANLSYVSLWPKDGVPQRFYKKVCDAYSNKTDSFPPTVCAAYGRGMLCWAYMNFRNGGLLSSMEGVDSPCLYDDYEILSSDMVSNLDKYYDCIDYDPVSKLQLLKRKTRAPKTLITETPIVVTSPGFNKEFNIFHEGSADSLAGKTLLFNFNFKFVTPIVATDAVIVVTLADINKQTVFYQSMRFKWLRSHWNDKNGIFKNSLILSPVPRNATSLAVYLWNPDKDRYKLSRGVIGIYKLGL